MYGLSSCMIVERPICLSRYDIFWRVVTCSFICSPVINCVDYIICGLLIVVTEVNDVESLFSGPPSTVPCFVRKTRLSTGRGPLSRLIFAGY